MTRDIGVRGDETATDNPDGRRSFLKKVGVGAAVAWTAPVLASGVASAGPGTGAGACPGPMVWGSTVFDRTGGTITTGTIPTSYYPLSYSAAGNTFGLSISDPTGAYQAGGSFPSGIDSVFPRSGEPDSYHVQMNGTGAGPITITMSFVLPVINLAFTVLDVDTTAGAPPSGYADRINVTATNVGAPTPGLATFTGDPPVQEVIANVEYVGTANVPNGSANGDVGFTFAGPVDVVTIIYSRAAATTSQGIGISTITCG